MARGFTSDGRPLSGPVFGLDGLKLNRGDRDCRRVALDVATSLQVAFPPLGQELVPCEILVLNGLDVLGHLRTAVPIREPEIDISGDLGTLAVGPSGSARQIRSPRIGDNPVTVELPQPQRRRRRGWRTLSPADAQGPQELAVFDVTPRASSSSCPSPPAGPWSPQARRSWSWPIPISDSSSAGTSPPWSSNARPLCPSGANYAGS